MATRVKQQWLYRVDVTVTDEEMSKMKSWCETNTSGAWRVNTRFIDYFQFEKDSDAMMFMLKFGGAQ